MIMINSDKNKSSSGLMVESAEGRVCVKVIGLLNAKNETIFGASSAAVVAS